MPDPTLTEIRERLARATPGLTLARTAEDSNPEVYLIGANYQFFARCVGHPDDVALWVNAPTDIAYLLAEVERLQKALQTVSTEGPST